jgi:hypothetical protein
VTKMQVQGNHTKIDKCIQINGREWYIGKTCIVILPWSVRHLKHNEHNVSETLFLTFWPFIW